MAVVPQASGCFPGAGTFVTAFPSGTTIHDEESQDE